jgi:glycosyltransferase involved in cell wall biosynthesis
MRGGQWQVLYLVERLENAILSARGPLAERGLPSGSLFDQADLIHAHDARSHTRAVLANRKPLVVSRRVAFPVRRSFLSRQKYERAAMYIAVSHFVADRLRDAGIPDSKIRVVYDGVPVPQAPTTAEPGRVIALKSKPVDLPGVHLTTDLWQDLTTASIFVYASEMEGLGSAALAAMAAGVPVIASRVGGLSEIVQHGETGILVDDNNFESAIRQLLAEPARAAEMGRRGRELVRERFTIDHMVAETREVYEEVLA